VSYSTLFYFSLFFSTFLYFSLLYSILCLPHVPDQAQQAQAHDSVRGSVPAPSVPVLGSITIAALHPIDHGPAPRDVCPLAIKAWRTDSGTRASTVKSPGYIVCGKGEAGKLRVDQRADSIACWTSMPKSIMFRSVCIVRMT